MRQGVSQEEISYRGHFDIEIAGRADQIGSVVLLRSDHNTHSLTTADRYVKLAFRVKDQGDKEERRGNGDKRDRDDEAELRVVAPEVPAQAVPGIYMLFVVDQNGVPSVGKKLVLEPETRRRSFEFK